MPPTPTATPPAPAQNQRTFRVSADIKVGQVIQVNGAWWKVQRLERTGEAGYQNAVVQPSGAPPRVQAPQSGQSGEGTSSNRFDILGGVRRRLGGSEGGGETTEGTSREELTVRCLQGDLEACSTLLVINEAVPQDDGQGGLSYEQQLALQENAQGASMEQLLAQLGLNARGEAQRVTEGISTGLASSLAALGMAAPEIFLANAGDPAAIRDALLRALESGEGVFPTLERQNLIGQVAQSPTDIVRLLFLSGGQTPPERRTGAFNVKSVLEEGGRAREGLARQIAATPRVTFDDLVNRFMPPLPGAAKGAVIEMRRNKSGLYEAAKGATIAEGPEIFTVGEGGKTEYALLAPGSVIAPMLDGEKPTRDGAMRAVMDMLLYGKRQQGETKKPVKKGKPSEAQAGGLVSEADLPLQTLSSLLEGFSAAGASLQRPERGPFSRIQDMRLQLFPFPGVTPDERGRVLATARDDPNLRDFLSLGLTDRANNPKQYAIDQILEERARLEGLLTFAEQRDDPTMYNLVKEQLAALTPGNEAEQLRLLDRYMSGEQLRGIEESLREGGGAPGGQLPFLQVEGLPAGARAATLTVLGSLFGADVVSDLVDLFRQGRSQAFESGASRLAVSR